MMQSISIYDMDKTIIRKASWTHWLFHYARTEAPVRLLLAPLLVMPLVGYALGILDRKGLKQATQLLLMGRRVPREKVERAAAAFADAFGAREELAGALAAIDADRAEGRELWLATASCRYFVEALARRWRFDLVIATENRWEGEMLTPKIEGENCYEMGKLRKILARLEARPDHLKFTSDHLSDLPVLDWADDPVVANPHPPLRLVAQARGWPIFDWARAAPATGP